MANFSQALAKQMDTIADRWVEAIRQDRQIKSAEALPRIAVQNHLLDDLKSMVIALSRIDDSDIEMIVQNSLHHGRLRAAQGFTPQEIAREYYLLHKVIFSTLEPELLTGSVVEVIRTFRLLDAMLHEALAHSFKSYTAAS